MSDLRKALDDIVAIRLQVARGTTFRGYGPATLALTGALAFAVAAAQAIWLNDLKPIGFFGVWVGVAALACGLIGWEMITRSRRFHSALADAMIANAVDQFLPAGAAGACLGLVVLRGCPENLWMLPGLWQILVGLGLFASCRSLPRGIVLGAAWYMLTGFAVLMLASPGHVLSPWFMGLPFAGGQMLIAAILQHAYGVADAEG